MNAHQHDRLPRCPDVLSDRLLRAPHDCPVLLPNHCPAYISAERFWANQERMQQNRADALGAPRQGPALLSGLLTCGRCGYRMVVNYNNARNGLRYNCHRALTCYGEPECQSLSGKRLDAFIAEQVLAALQPAALELHLAAAADLEKQRQELHRHWQQKLERARYDAERAARQYDAVEPENRLVARELERRWQDALHEQQRLHQEYDVFGAQRPLQLSATQRTQVRALAQDIPELWASDQTTTADRQRLVRLLIERIVLTVQGRSEQVTLAITWAGGFVSEHAFARSVNSYEQLADYPRLCARIEELRRHGRSMDDVAETLNAEGFRPPRRVTRYSGGMVAGLLARKYGKAGQTHEQRLTKSLRRGEWFLGDMARHLGMPPATLHHWRRAGWLHARKLPVTGLWAIVATGPERRRLARLRRHQQTKPNQEIPKELKIPAAINRQS